MSKQFGQQDNDSSFSNANQNFTDSAVTLRPPAFQLKTENASNQEESADSESIESPFQLATSDPVPPSDNNKGSQNNTGIPDNLKSGVENLSGFSLDNVNVHYNSDKPAQLNAHAYAQGTDIHLGSGQEKHLPHEAWHVVQQKQGRVQATTQKKGIGINDDSSLEKEADVKGRMAMQFSTSKPAENNHVLKPYSPATQLVAVSEDEMDVALDVADDMIEDIGGYETIDEIFGSGFSDRYYDIIVEMESGELNFDGFIDQLPEEEQFGIYEEIDIATTQYNSLFDLVYDEAAKDPEEVNQENVELGISLIYELEIRMELLSTLNKYYELLVMQGFVDLIPTLIGFCQLIVKFKYFFLFGELKNRLLALNLAVLKAEIDIAKALAETGIDLALGAVAIGLTTAGMMTPGLNIAIFLGGIAIGFALSTEESSAQNVQIGTKIGGGILSVALENSEKFGGHMGKIKSIGPGLDLILNSKEAYDKYQDLAKVQTELKEFENYYDKECKTLESDFSRDMKKLKGMVEHAEKIFDANWDTLSTYESQIASLQTEIQSLTG